MASFVLLIKVYESDKKVVYKFGPNENEMGKMELNKLSKNFFQLEPIPNPKIPSQFYFDRAAQKLTVCLVREGGKLPERSTFES